MDPMLIMLALTQAAKFAMMLSEQVGTGEITPEEAKAKWTAQSNSWNATADAWFATKAPNLIDSQ
jgi:hypothetical protein